MKVGIVIPVVNLWTRYTRLAIGSLKTKHSLRVVIVDNGSTDETEAACMRLVSDDFHYKKNGENKGVSWAWNYGVKDCFINHSCDYVLVCNNDVLFSQGAIDALVDRFEKAKAENDEKLVLATCMNIYGEVKENPLSILTYEGSKKAEVGESEHPDFSGFMINRRCWETVGEFDEGFSPAYYEDNSYHRRIKLAGFQAICLPTAPYIHYGSKTQQQWINRPLADTPKSHQYFIAKWGGEPELNGTLGTKLWTHPFNDSKKDLKWTLQSACQADCTCEVNCQTLIQKYKTR